MTRISRAALAVYLLSALSSTVMAQSPSPTPVKVAGAVTTLDCYDTLASNPTDEEIWNFQSDGHCQEICTAKKAKVMITSGGSSCFCGNVIPAPSHKVDQEQCNMPCTGFPQQNCGGLGTYQYYLTSLGSPTIEQDDPSSSAKASQTPSSSNTAAPAVITETATSAPQSGGSSKVGIAVGVVVGVLVVAAIAGAGVFFYKRRRNQQIQEEHNRTAAINGFAKGPKSEASSANDSRLDPSIYSARRDSLGSIADERDFSRRILQVRNPDRESRASHV